MQGSTDLQKDTETGTKESEGCGKGGGCAVAEFGNLLPLISRPVLGLKGPLPYFQKVH